MTSNSADLSGKSQIGTLPPGAQAIIYTTPNVTGLQGQHTDVAVVVGTFVDDNGVTVHPTATDVAKVDFTQPGVSGPRPSHFRVGCVGGDPGRPRTGGDDPLLATPPAS